MTLGDRIESFSELGRILRESLEGRETGFTSRLRDLIASQQYHNAWFTPDNVTLALRSIANELTTENLSVWTAGYPELEQDKSPVNVGVIMAGNIPLAGFHDFLSILITGNNLIARTSSRDKELIAFAAEILCYTDVRFRERILFTEGLLKGFDAVIATGSDNSSRYFEYYFRKCPHIIRKNRNSIAVIEGSETSEELTALGLDIFSYFGLGCRNVSKIFVPEGYDLEGLTRNWSAYSSIADHNKYANNYDYNRAVFMVNCDNFIDSGFILLKESRNISSPVAVLFYESYNSLDQVLQMTESDRERIQSIVGRNHIPFGQAQMPHLWDYADDVDTIEFLLKKNEPRIM